MTRTVRTASRRLPPSANVALVLCLAALASCDSPSAAAQPEVAVTNPPTEQPAVNARRPVAAPSGAPAKAAAVGPIPTLPTRFPAAPRIVAFGDVHGDLKAATSALQLAGATGEDGHWSGGALVVVQTGDQLDRGDDEQAIIDWFDELAEQAEKAGGAFHVLNGNHEFMNAAGDLRYVTPGGFTDFEDVPELPRNAPAIAKLPASAQARAAAFAPGGPYARRLAHRNTAVIVGSTVFVHGGVEPKYAARLEQLNAGARAWLWGAKTAATETMAETMAELMAPDGLVWTRRYSLPEPAAEDCASLGESLSTMNVTRMVVGHTVQKAGITSACEERVWRVDVGMAKHYGGSPAVLEITGEKVRSLAL